MEFYPEMFLSKWHLIVIVLTLIAFIAMVVGGYAKDTIIKSTLKSLVAFYILVTIPVAIFVGEAKMMEEEMIAGLDDTYEMNEGAIVNSHLVAFVGSFEDEDGDYDVKVYAGNYDNTETFEGDLKVIIYGENGEVLKEKNYEEITLDPGSKMEIDSYFSTDVPHRFQYMFSE